MKRLLGHVAIAAAPGLLIIMIWAAISIHGLRAGWPLAAILCLGLFGGVFATLEEGPRSN